MSPFTMCRQCASKYADAMDRRYHAQPIACPDCGPQITLVTRDGDVQVTEQTKAITQCAQMIKQGSVGAVKGVGGFIWFAMRLTLVRLPDYVHLSEEIVNPWLL